jgi:hypothetical protein
MAKSKNVKLNVEPEGQQTIDLSDVDTSPSAGSALATLRANAEPKTAAPRTRSRRTTDATEVVKSLDTPALGEAYEKTSAMVARSEKPSRVGPERPLVNLNKKPIEGVEPKLVERLDEEPTNVPRNFDKDGAFRNQIHGDYSHFAKVTNLIGFLGEKAGAAQEALGVDHPDTPKFDEIHKILSIAQGHLMDAQRAHQRGETGLVRVNPETGLAKPIGRQFLKDGREDPFGGQAMERAIGYNPIAKINQAIGEPQLRSEGMTTQSLDSAPFGAVPHYHRAIQHIVTAANLLQGSLADVSSSQKLGSFDGAVKSWDGRYDERPGDPDTVTHAQSLSDDYANSVAKSGSEIVKSNDDMTETGTSSVLELFNNTKKSYESEFNAKVQQAEIHAGLVAKNYREIFGGDIAARRAEAARKTEELKTLPVVPGPLSFNNGDGMWGGSSAPLESRIAKEQNATDQEYAAERARVSLKNSSSAVGSLDNYLKIAKDAVAAGKLDASKLDELNGHAEEAKGHHESALAKASSEIEMPAEPELTYDSSRDPRFRPDPIKYERMSATEKAAERNKFLASRGQTLAAWQKESKAFEDKLPVIQARDASALADHKAAVAGAILGHHTAVADSAGKAIKSVSKMHDILTSAGVITPSEPAPVPADITGIPTPEQYAKVSRPGRLATRAEALEFMNSENAKAAAESEAKAKAEAERKAALEASRPERGSAIEQAKELGFLTLDEGTAQSFLDAGKGTVTPGMAAAGNPGAAGKRRADFLSGLAVQGSVEFSATPKPLSPGKAIFIAPDTGIPATPANPVNPKKTRRREAAVTRLNAAAAESGRRRLAGQVNNLGLNLEDVTVPEPKPERVRRTAAPVNQEEEDTRAILEGLQRSEATASGLAAARNNLANIQEFNSENAATTVGTTIKPTRRTRK